MRRLLAIGMLLLLVLPLGAPALAQGTRARVLLCCLRGGAHHCMTGTPDGQSALQAPCPVCGTSTASSHHSGGMVVAVASGDLSHAVAPLRVRAVEVGYQIAYLRSRNKRGPPAPHLA